MESRKKEEEGKEGGGKGREGFTNPNTSAERPWFCCW